MDAQILLIGSSLGGLRALQVLLPAFPVDFQLPIVIVQHRSKDSGGSLEALMQRYSPLPIVEIEDMTNIQGGRVYIAPADYHVLIERQRFRLSTEAPVLYARPSIDVALESAADAYGSGVVAIILTGTGRDGAQGARQVNRHGGRIFVQQPETAEARMMPDSAIAAAEDSKSGIAVLPIDGIAAVLLDMYPCSRRNRICEA